MGIFEQFPYTYFHEINIDWILKALKKCGEKLNAYDDTSAVQAYIGYATNKGYGVVFFPAGDYSISTLTMILSIIFFWGVY